MNQLQLYSGVPVAAPITLDRARRAEIARAVRREEILDAARRVFAERGFKGTTIADIAEGTGIALGTVYLYFASKDEVFAALNRRLVQLIITIVTGVGMRRRPGAHGPQPHRQRVRVCGEPRPRPARVLNMTATRSGKASTAARPSCRSSTRWRPPWSRADPFDPGTMTRLVFGAVSFAVYQAFVI
jgi:AcrR family transcriptional regulator